MPHDKPRPERDVRTIDQLWIEVPGGIRLSARLWLPHDAEISPVPAIVDYHPYRGCDFAAVRDSTIYPRLAAYGFACIKLDVRGTGNSEGLHIDQFAEEYLDDAVAALAWIARQNWCNGNIGMTGVSWAAHAALMVATRRPPSLKAIIPITAADDRYLNRYQGGCLLLYTVWWGAIYGSMQSRPPLPEAVGAGWRESWLRRLDATRNYLDSWLAHPTPDGYWAAGSAAADFSRIACPVFTVAGWSDPGYAVNVPRLLVGLSVPRQGLIGPWGHRAPHFAMPGPGIDFIALAARWFARWLNGETAKETAAGAPDPYLAAWMMDGVAPDATRSERPGRWVVEKAWPSPHGEQRRLVLGAGTLGESNSDETVLTIRSPLTIGMAASGEWMPWYPAGPGPDIAGEQRLDDAVSLVFDSAPLGERLEILGSPVLTLEIAADRQDAQIVVRLCDVAPDGASARVTYGFLNLRSRNGEAAPSDVVPGERYTIRLPLYPIGYGFPAGHRIRIAVSTSYWPIIWPAREAATLSVYAGRGALELPVRPPCPDGEHPDPLGPPAIAAGMAVETLRPARSHRLFRQDAASGKATLTVEEDGGHTRQVDSGIELWSSARREFAIHPADPLSAVATAEALWGMKQGDWQIETRMRAVTRADHDHFRVHNDLDAFEGGTRIHARSWDLIIPRSTV